MGLFTDAVSRSQQIFPSIIIKYKDESTLMKLLGKVLFFNKEFMTYTTTLGSTIYFPSAAKVRISPVSNSIILLHEVSHVYESKKRGFVLHSFLYLFPQILALLAIPAFILFGWQLALLCLFFLLPIPAYFRMEEEKQAYTMSLYVMNKLNNLYNFNINVEDHKNNFVEEFSSSSYWYMWPISGIQEAFDFSLAEIKHNGKPKYDSALYEIMDKIVEG